MSSLQGLIPHNHCRLQLSDVNATSPRLNLSGGEQSNLNSGLSHRKSLPYRESIGPERKLHMK